MFGIVFLSLLVATIVVGCLIVAMMADVAFAGPRLDKPYSIASARRAGNAERIFDGARLALRLEQAVSRVVASLGMNQAVAGTCDAACREREILVTTPEVLAMAQELRDRQTPAQIHAIRMQAERNLMAHDLTHHCPLLMSGGFCACEASRPVSCRTRCLAGADSPVEARKLAETVGTGVTDIFRDCLDASGLDHSRYELNYALAHVLETPDAAQRWARGEQLMKSPTATADA